MKIVLLTVGPISMSLAEAVAAEMSRALGWRALISLWGERLDLPAMMDLKEGKLSIERVNEALRSRYKEFIEAGGKLVVLIFGRCDRKVCGSIEAGLISVCLGGAERPEEVVAAIKGSVSAY